MEQYTDEPIFRGMNLIDLNDAIKALHSFVRPDPRYMDTPYSNKFQFCLHLNREMMNIMFRDTDNIEGYLDSYFGHVKNNKPLYTDLIASNYNSYIKTILEEFEDNCEEYERVKQVNTDSKTIQNMANKWIRDYENYILRNFTGRKKLLSYVDPKYLEHINKILSKYPEYEFKYTPY